MRANQLYLLKEAKAHIRMAGKIHVRAHRRRNGSYVKAHWRKRPCRGFELPRAVGTTAEQLDLFEISETDD